MQIRAKVLIPTLLFVALAIPAILVPITLAHQSDTVSQPNETTTPYGPLQLHTEGTMPYEPPLAPDYEVQQSLERHIGD
jgi:hypothetical protein